MDILYEITEIEKWIKLYYYPHTRLSLNYNKTHTGIEKLISYGGRQMMISDTLFRLLFVSVTGREMDSSSVLSETSGYHDGDWYLAHLNSFSRKLIIDELLNE